MDKPNPLPSPFPPFSASVKNTMIEKRVRVPRIHHISTATSLAGGVSTPAQSAPLPPSVSKSVFVSSPSFYSKVVLVVGLSGVRGRGQRSYHNLPYRRYHRRPIIPIFASFALPQQLPASPTTPFPFAPPSPRSISVVMSFVTVATSCPGYGGLEPALSPALPLTPPSIASSSSTANVFLRFLALNNARIGCDGQSRGTGSRSQRLLACRRCRGAASSPGGSERAAWKPPLPWPLPRSRESPRSIGGGQKTSPRRIPPRLLGPGESPLHL